MRFVARSGSRDYQVRIERVQGRYVIDVEGKRYEVDAQKLEGDFYSILAAGRSYEVSVERVADGYRVRHRAGDQRVTINELGRSGSASPAAAGGPERIVSLMPGKVVRLLAAVGDRVEAGQGVAIVEAMKMENEIVASKAGRVRTIEVEPGQTVEGGALLMVVE